MKTPTWKNTFNTSHKFWWNLTAAVQAASNAGYKFIAWNDRVYAVMDSLATVPTDYTVDDL